MNLEKYKWKNRVILIETSSYKDINYIKTKEIYEKNIKEFHKRFVKLLTNRGKDLKFKISLIGFDGDVKKVYKKLEPKKVFKLVDKMPMGKLMKENSNLKPKNLSLYSDYNKETTITGLGFKDKEKAVETLKKIESKSLNYQKQVVNTMIGRAENHPHKTNGMTDAVKVFKKWLRDNVKN